MFRSLIFILIITSIFAVSKTQAQEAINTVEFGDDGVVYLENFEGYGLGTIPDEWYNRDGDNIPATYDDVYKDDYKYKVTEENGNKFLRYQGTEAKHLNFPLVDKTRINILETPILKWDWRIFDIPEGGDEDSGDRNDVAASVYVVFDTSRILFQRVPVSIRYTWSSKYPKGSTFSKLRGRQRIIVIGTGDENLGEWQTVERNIVEDYREIFDKTPPKTPIAILILSDADDTLSDIKADYDNFELHPE